MSIGKQLPGPLELEVHEAMDQRRSNLKNKNTGFVCGNMGRFVSAAFEEMPFELRDPKSSSVPLAMLTEAGHHHGLSGLEIPKMKRVKLGDAQIEAFN